MLRRHSGRRRPTRPADSTHAARPVCTEMLEPRLLMAAALKLGGSGTSGTLSTNPVTRQQQLICDPNEPKAGSMSVAYDPSKVTLRDTFANDQRQPASIDAGPGYVLDEELVEVTRFGEEGSFTTLVPFDSLSDSSGFETGYLQVKFHLTGTAGQIEPDGTVVDEAGVDGVDPFAVTFNHVEPGPILTIVEGGNFAAAATDAVDLPPPNTTSYTIFAAGDNQHSGNAEDFFITNDGTNTRIGHNDISPATVSFTDVPLEDQAAAVQVSPDPGQPGRQALFAVGTDAPETIVFTKQGGGLKVSITNNDTNQTTTYGPFTGFDRVIAYGRGGDDTIRMDAQGSQSVLFFGGDGTDTLVAGNGGSILSGGNNNPNDPTRLETLIGGNGADLLFGGRGLDTLNGGNGEDILVGEHTNFDEGTPRDVRDLTWMFNEWSKGGKYEVRISHLTGAPGGQNSTAFFNLSGQNKNVWDDGKNDVFAGGNGRDWIITGSSTGSVSHDKDEIVSVVS